jgi:hypothetical protein
MIRLSDTVAPMHSLRHQLNVRRWITVLFLLAQIFVQVAITAHASEHTFHNQGSYCDALDHADHQQGSGIVAVPPVINLLKTDSQNSVSLVKNVFLPPQYSFNQRAPPVSPY